MSNVTMVTMNTEQFNELIDALSAISDSISHLDKTISDTSGSYKMGVALDSIPTISATLSDIADSITVIEERKEEVSNDQTVQ